MTVSAMEVFISTLPSVAAFSSRPKPRAGRMRPPPAPPSLIPDCSAVYFIVDGNAKVQYVGATKNLRSRWFQHHVRPRVKFIRGARLAWVTISAEYLTTVEAQFIRKLNPPLNVNQQRYPAA